MYRHFRLIAKTKYIPEWKSKQLYDEIIKGPTTSDNSTVFFGKETLKRSTCAVMIRIIISFRNQIFL